MSKSVSSSVGLSEKRQPAPRDHDTHLFFCANSSRRDSCRKLESVTLLRKKSLVRKSHARLSESSQAYSSAPRARRVDDRLRLGWPRLVRWHAHHCRLVDGAVAVRGEAGVGQRAVGLGRCAVVAQRRLAAAPDERHGHLENEGKGRQCCLPRRRRAGRSGARRVRVRRSSPAGRRRARASWRRRCESCGSSAILPRTAADE